MRTAYILFFVLFFSSDPVRAQSALQTVAYIDAQRRVTDEKWRVQEDENILTFYNPANDRNYRKIEKINFCKYKIHIKRSNENTDNVYTLDFTNLRIGNSTSGRPDGFGLIRVSLDGVKVCNISNELMADDVKMGACTDKFSRVVERENLDAFSKALSYLSASHCKSNAF